MGWGGMEWDRSERETQRKTKRERETEKEKDGKGERREKERERGNSIALQETNSGSILHYWRMLCRVSHVRTYECIALKI